MNAEERIRKYCAYRDRCHSEVRYKLLEIGVRGMELEKIITDLIAENYLNEERFALNYATGKAKYNQWGKSKILTNLKQKQISAYLCKKAIANIDMDMYRTNIELLIDKMLERFRVHPKFMAVKKIRDTMLRKGYRYEEFSEVLDKLIESRESDGTVDALSPLI